MTSPYDQLAVMLGQNLKNETNELSAIFTIASVHLQGESGIR